MHVAGVADSLVVVGRMPAVVGRTEAVGYSLAEEGSLAHVGELLKSIKKVSECKPYLDDSSEGKTYLQ